MQRHAHPQRPHLPPGLPGYRSLSRDRRSHRIGSHRKGSIDRIANHFEDEAAMAGNHGPQQSIVASQGHAHRFWMMFPARGAAFNIGEEKGDGPSRCLRHT